METENIFNSFVQPQLVEVYEVQEATTADVFRLYITMIDAEGNTVQTWYTSLPDDVFGLNPTIRQWLFDNSEFPKTPYVPPTPEELRALMPPLARTKFKLALSRAGLKTANIQGLIDAIEDENTMDEMQIIWDDEQSFARLSAFVVNVIGAARTPEQIDTIWESGLAL